MKNQQLGMLLLLATTLASVPLALAVPATKGSVLRVFNLYQNNSTGGAHCSGQLNCFNSTDPGPTLTVNQGDSVSIMVHNNDTTQHTFNITSASYTAVAHTGSMNPGVVKTLTFTASTSGTFNYRCDIHPNDMNGIFKVNPVSGAPITSASLLGLVFTTTAVAYITMRKRR